MHVLTILCNGSWMSTNLSEGWRRLGYSVEEFFYGTHMGKSWSAGGLRKNHQINASLLATAKRLKAEGNLTLIFAVIYDDVLAVETAQQLRDLDVPMVNYHVDLVGQWYRILRTGKYFDRVACAQTDNWAGLRRVGIRPYYMPMAANPPLSDVTSASIPFSGLVYLGSPWSYRRQILANLAQSQIPLRIYGHNWLCQTREPTRELYRKNLHDFQYYFIPRWRDGRNELLETIRRRIWSLPPSTANSIELLTNYIQGSYTNTDFIPLVQGAAINLGFTHFQGIPGTTTERRQVRLREFEIPMAGGFYLTQDCVQLRELFKVGEHVVTWNALPDLQDKISYYLSHAAERRQITQAAQTHCLQKHTWAIRFRSLLQELNLPLPSLV